MYRFRWLQGRTEGNQSRNKVRLLLGARQTGKTMLLRHTVAGEPARVFNLQESDLRRRFEADPASFRREVLALPTRTKRVVVDEIQKVPALLDEVQALYDASKTARQFFLTGSSARRLRTGTANLLPGRSHVFHLHPVCRWEMKARDSLAFPAPRMSKADSSSPGFELPPLHRLLRFGSLPGILGEPVGTAAATLASYVETYLEEEIRREAVVRDMGPFLVFLRLAATESGRQMNLVKLSQESSVPATTLKTYYQVLVDTFVGHWLQVYTRRARKRLLSTPRFYLFDVGVRNAAAELALGAQLPGEIGGPLLEHWVAQELMIRASYLGAPHRVSFWRTASGAEVDFVWESAKEDVPVEVKWTDRPRPQDARHLELFLDEYPDRARRGLLICRCPEPQQLTERVLATSWDRL